MDLGLKDKLFIVCGASSGFGKAIAESLINEKAKVIAIARNAEKMQLLKSASGVNLEIISADVTEPSAIKAIEKQLGGRTPDGVLVNAGGPPAMPFVETIIDDWDRAYRQVLRWKVELTASLLPVFRRNRYGRFVYIESASVRQPLENMILSTSLRLAVTGFVKSLSGEIADSGVTFNIIAPGYHQTAAIDRIINKMSRDKGISAEEALKQISERIPAKKLGDPLKLASLALWLLSPASEYVTGQVFTIDGGLVRNTL